MAMKYESVHKVHNGPGDARPTALQIIQDEQLEGKWSDKTILITGTSSGIGVGTARALFETGATLYLTARDLKKAKTVLGPILDSDRVHLIELDLNSLASVRKCADSFMAKSDRLNILINNAGVMATPEGRTQDGFETQFGTNHLAHFLLIQLLLPTLLKSTTSDFQSRVVILSSSGHRNAEVNFANLNLKGEYDPWVAYGQSKTANLWTANELERRYGSKGLHAWSVHPGGINTGLGVHVLGEVQNWLTNPVLYQKMKSVEQGASSTVWAATAAALEGLGGKYVEDCQFAKPAKADAGGFVTGYGAHAYDEKKEGLLWEKSLELVEPFLS